MPSVDSDTIQEWRELLDSASAQEILQWAVKVFGDQVAATSSFQSQSVPLLHLISKTVPELPIIFLETGFHFPETLELRDQLTEELGLNVRSVKTQMGHDGFQEEYGALYKKNPDLCCHINKVKPLDRALSGFDAWISGIRRDQSPRRSDTPVVSKESEELVKICPMVEWTNEEVWDYVDEHGLPYHPLLEDGYLSIGCAPCTRPVEDGEDARTGRWSGKEKTECGLHLDDSPDHED